MPRGQEDGQGRHQELAVVEDQGAVGRDGQTGDPGGRAVKEAARQQEGQGLITVKDFEKKRPTPTCSWWPSKVPVTSGICPFI